MKPGDLVIFNEEGRRLFPRTRIFGPWEVLRVGPYGIVTVRKISQKSGRAYKYRVAKMFLDVVVAKEEKRNEDP